MANSVKTVLEEIGDTLIAEGYNIGRCFSWIYFLKVRGHGYCHIASFAV